MEGGVGRSRNNINTVRICKVIDKNGRPLEHESIGKWLKPKGVQELALNT